MIPTLNVCTSMHLGYDHWCSLFPSLLQSLGKHLFFPKAKSSISSCFPTFPRSPGPQPLLLSTAPPVFSSALRLPLLLLDLHVHYRHHPGQPGLEAWHSLTVPRGLWFFPQRLSAFASPGLSHCPPCVNPHPSVATPPPLQSCPLPPCVLHPRRALSSPAVQVVLSLQAWRSQMSLIVSITLQCSESAQFSNQIIIQLCFLSYKHLRDISHMSMCPLTVPNWVPDTEKALRKCAWVDWWGISLQALGKGAIWVKNSMS